MSPPKATGDKADIQRVIEESAGSYTFKYPQKGDYRSAVIMHDINGDGTDEAVAFYKSNTPDGVSDITVIFIDPDIWRMAENRRVSEFRRRGGKGVLFRLKRRRLGFRADRMEQLFQRQPGDGFPV